MEKAKFTPGPWEVNFHGVNLRVGTKYLPICEVLFFAKSAKDNSEAEANAALIAAAPAMYAALEYYCNVLDEATGKQWRDQPDHVEKEILKALALARGETPD